MQLSHSYVSRRCPLHSNDLKPPEPLHTPDLLKRSTIGQPLCHSDLHLFLYDSTVLFGIELLHLPAQQQDDTNELLRYNLWAHHYLPHSISPS